MVDRTPTASVATVLSFVRKLPPSNLLQQKTMTGAILQHAQSVDGSTMDAKLRSMSCSARERLSSVSMQA